MHGDSYRLRRVFLPAVLIPGPALLVLRHILLLLLLTSSPLEQQVLFPTLKVLPGFACVLVCAAVTRFVACSLRTLL